MLIAFSVTRVIFVPQGDLLAYGTLTIAALQSGRLPAALWAMDALSAAALVISLVGTERHGVRRAVIANFIYPLVVTVAAWQMALLKLPTRSFLIYHYWPHHHG